MYYVIKDKNWLTENSQMILSIVEEALLFTRMVFSNYIFSKVSKSVLVHSFAIQRKQFGVRSHPEPQLQTFQIEKIQILKKKIWAIDCLWSCRPWLYGKMKTTQIMIWNLDEEAQTIRQRVVSLIHLCVCVCVCFIQVTLVDNISFRSTAVYFDFFRHSSVLTTKSLVSIHHHKIDPLYPFAHPSPPSPLVITTLFSVSMCFSMFSSVC